VALPLAPTCTAPFLSVGAAEQNDIALPADEVLAGEFDPHASALRVAWSEQLIGRRWRRACSSELDGAHDGRLECCPNYLYLYRHCALKGVPEAIIEGMGGVRDRCARPERHISFEAGVQEAVVCWNAPKSYHADANDFLERALSLHFKDAAWHFAHTSAATTLRAEQNKVLQRIAKHESKLRSSLESGT
jgi:hypothetical protein